MSVLDRKGAFGKWAGGLTLRKLAYSEAMQMDNSQLKNALKAHDEAKRNVRSGALAVWEALSKADPELAAEILQLFSTVEAAATWFTSDLDDFNGSAAHQVAEGRSADVLSRVRKAAHGFVG